MFQKPPNCRNCFNKGNIGVWKVGFEARSKLGNPCTAHHSYADWTTDLYYVLLDAARQAGLQVKPAEMRQLVPEVGRMLHLLVHLDNIVAVTVFLS